jgi:hypothetical protein
VDGSSAFWRSQIVSKYRRWAGGGDLLPAFFACADKPRVLQIAAKPLIHFVRFSASFAINPLSRHE